MEPHNHYCPIQIVHPYHVCCPAGDAYYFLHSDATKVLMSTVQQVFVMHGGVAGLDLYAYSCHGLRARKCIDMVLEGHPTASVTAVGHWLSLVHNAYNRPVYLLS